MGAHSHWEHVYQANPSDAVSWYRPHLDTSLALIQRAAPDPASAIIDVGGGASTLVDDLLQRGYRNVTVLDISQQAIEIAQKRLGSAGANVHWLVGDVAHANLPRGVCDVWHDRALFHFLTEPSQRAAYVTQLTSTLKSGGHAIISTFGPQGPQKCSGLDVSRYDFNSLQRELGDRFQLKQGLIEEHNTSAGAVQQFLYCSFQWS
jgi:2-polyprenyl-3-methyl-5-hydroxy-6-metoxy-1,4-benzoquinol methylase